MIRKRKDFKQAIKTLSCWKVGNKDYNLPNGEKCSQYIKRLIEKVFDVHGLMIDSNGDIIDGCLMGDKYVSLFGNETCDEETQEKRIYRLTIEFFR